MIFSFVPTLSIISSADPDREGEGIAFHVANALIEKGQSDEKFKRVVFHEITEKAVKEAFDKAGISQNPKTGEKVNTPEKTTIHFKMSKELFNKINNKTNSN